MRIKFFFTNFLLLFLIKTQAQTLPNGLYISEDKNELMCLKNDTISLRLYNDDAFNTYMLFLGSYKSNNSKIKLRKNIIHNETSRIIEGTAKDNLIQIYLSYSDDTPIKFAQVTLSNESEKKRKITKYSNEGGYLELHKEEINNLSGSCVKIKVETLGFITEQLVILKLGKSYSIISKTPASISFTILNKKAKLNYKKHSQKIEINSFNNRKITFIKVGECESCWDVLFKLD